MNGACSFTVLRSSDAFHDCGESVTGGSCGPAQPLLTNDPVSLDTQAPRLLLPRTGGTPQRPAANHLTAPHGQKGLSAALLHIADYGARSA